ncbi:MAG: hypothetical protein H6713_30215 [Myxococcales bacterium]|nr:hypothetical protein [Myxococcales bacterium]
MRAQRRYRATRRDASTRALPLLLLCVSLVPGAARAAPAPDEAPAEEPADPDAELLKRVSELYLKGRALFESSEFNAAIELWAQAYAELPLSERFTSQRSRLLLELASAHMRAYEVDGELTHVRKAEPLFVEYLATLDASDASTTATREMVAEQRARVQAILEEERRREAARAAAERDAAARLAAERERRPSEPRSASASRRPRPATGCSRRAPARPC